MAYSPDNSKANQENPSTPAVNYSITEQLLYKIASLDSAVQAGFRRLDEKMDRVQSDLHDSQISTNDRINNLDKEFTEAIAFKRQRIDNLERVWEERYRNRCEYTDKKLHDIETWQKVAMARAGIVGAAIVIIWTFVSPAVQHLLGIPS